MSRNYEEKYLISTIIPKILSVTFFLGLLLMVCILPQSRVQAASKIKYQGRVIATKDSHGVITFRPSGGDDHAELEYILNNDKRKSVVLPKGSTIKIGSVVSIGSNTMLNATGATIIQTNSSYGVLKNDVDAINYNSAHNITIVGGTWKNKYNNQVYTAARFAHARSLKFKNMTIIANFKSHALELIACKDVKVYNCNLLESNDATRSSTSVEDALQIDVATPRTAPGVYRETGNKKYVNGQTCQNIRVEKCTIYGSRGVCANYARYESEFHNRYHRNIVIYKCKITGTSSQAVALYNTIDAIVQGNTIKNYSKQYGMAYPSGLHLQLFGKSSAGKNTIAYNKIYGVKVGIHVNTTYSSAKYASTRIIGNKIYVKNGSAIFLNGAGAVTKAKNTQRKW